jgi:hypothetical protein
MVTLATNYGKGFQDGYHTAHCKALPNFGPAGGGEDTVEYKIGFYDGMMKYKEEN